MRFDPLNAGSLFGIFPNSGIAEVISTFKFIEKKFVMK